MTDHPAPQFRPSGPRRGRPHPWLPARVYADVVALRAVLCSPLRVVLVFGGLGGALAMTWMLLF